MDLSPKLDLDFRSTKETASGTNPAHLSRDASSLAVPQEDSMCGDGPSVYRAALRLPCLREAQPIDNDVFLTSSSADTDLIVDDAVVSIDTTVESGDMLNCCANIESTGPL